MYSPSTLGETDEIISGSSLVVVTTNQISSHVGDEVVILNLTTGVYHGLNEVGSKIWSLIEEPKSLQSIQEILLAEYEVEATDCLDDLLQVLADLRKAGLIRVINETDI